MKPDFLSDSHFTAIRHQVAIVRGDGELLYSDLQKRIQATEEVIRKMGINVSDRVGMYADNSVGYVTFVLAALRLHVVVVPLNRRYPFRIARQMALDVGCRGIVTLYNESDRAEFSILNHTNRIEKTEKEREATLFFTSGSSGAPKAVFHTLANHYFSALGSNAIIPLRSGHRWLLNLPLYHVGGFSIIMRCLLAGAAIVIPKNSETFLDSLCHYVPTHISMVPTQLYRALKNEAVKKWLKNVEVILLGGAPIPEYIIDEGRRLGLKLYPTYGSTEMASQIWTNGKILPYHELKISAENEILVRGKSLFRGYVNHERAVDSEGWFHSADLGSIDLKGQLTISGRKDRMFISGGENIHPEEVESALRSLPNIERVVVVPIDDPEFGQRGVAFLKPFDTDKHYAALLEAMLPKYKIPVKFFAWPEIFSDELKVIWRDFQNWIIKSTPSNDITSSHDHHGDCKGKGDNPLNRK